MRFKSYVTIVLAMVCIEAAAAPSLEEFALPEEVRDAVVSPDGRYLAVIRSQGDRQLVLVKDLPANGQLTLVLSGDEKGDFEILWCRFANATRLLCGMRGTAMMRQFIVPNSAVAAVDADGKNLVQLLTGATGKRTGADDRIFDLVPDVPGKIVLRTGTGSPLETEQPTYLYTVDLVTGKSAHVKDSLDDRRLWNTFTDGLGHLRLGLGYRKRTGDFFSDPNGNVVVSDSRGNNAQSVYATSDGKEWRKLEKASEFASTHPFGRMAVDSASGRAFGFADNNGRIAMWELDMKDANAPTLAFSHPKANLDDVVTNGAGKIIGVAYEDAKPQVHYIDEKLTALIHGIDKAMPNRFNSVRSMATDGKLVVVASRGDVEPGRFFLYEEQNRSLKPIGSVNPKLDANQLASMRPIEYAAADGKKVSGYLTAKEPQPKNAPLIVLLHDGQGRTHWAYDELAQYLATRGYAVLSMNFRGSTGYGKEWSEAGRNKWGGEPYSDVVDGVKWAIAEGIADPRRVCMIGRGFSGYVALLGAIRDAGVFRCVASIGGVSDLVEFASLARLAGPPTGGARGGAPGGAPAEDDANKKQQKEESPMRNADKVQVPVLLVHGTHDTRAPILQAENMAKALEKAGKPHTFVKIERGTQYFWRASERATVLKEVDAFVTANLATTE